MSNDGQLIIYIIKLVLGGVAAFFAILLWSKTRDVAWMSLVAGTITQYIGFVYEMLCVFGIVVNKGLSILSIPIETLFFTVIPPLFYIIAFILMLVRSNK